MVSRAGLALAGLALLAGCSGTGATEGEVYPMPVSEVRAMLAAGALPPIFGSEQPTARVTGDGNGNIVWLVAEHGTDVVRFIARPEAVDSGHTRVTVEVKPPTDFPDDPQARLLEENPGIRRYYTAAMAEQVDATLERRAFEGANISGALVGVLREQIPLIGEQIEDLADSHGQDPAANAAPNPADGWAGDDSADWPEEGEDELAFGEPMDEASPDDDY